MCNDLCVTVSKSAIHIMDMTRESKLKNVFATPLLNNINNKANRVEGLGVEFQAQVQ